MSWSEYDESVLNQMKKDLEEHGDHQVQFNGTVGNLSLLIEATEFVKNMLK